MDDMWNSIRNHTLTGLQSVSHTNRLIITGISLGGALSLLSYVDIAAAKIFSNIEIVTFGAPRVGNNKWAEWFDEQTNSTRFFLDTDPIPVLPRCLTLLCTYQQTGTRISCNKKYEVCEYKEDDDFDFSSLKLGNLVGTVTEAVIEHATEEEHQPDGYGIGILDHIFEYKNLKDYTLVGRK